MADLARWTTRFAWLLLAAALACCAWSVAEWRGLRSVNAMIASRTIEKALPLPTDARVRYAAAWDLERSQHYEEAVQLYTGARAANDPALSSRAWFGLGNAYFELAIALSRAVTSEGPIVENAQFDLARDAYRAALRIDPELYGARYNLELLERLAPRRPGDGWRRNTDPIKIQPDRHNGWTTIRESAKRGLP